MHIRNADQLENLTPADYIRWRSGVLTEMALQLAPIFTEEELLWVIDGKQAMSIIRAGYHLHEHAHLAEKAGESLQDNIFFAMAEELRATFLTLEMVRMDGFYNEIFEKAIEYSRAFPYKTER